MNKITITDTFLKKLNRLKRPPKSLTYKGLDFPDYKDKPMVAIVGTRKPTPYGIYTTKLLAFGLAKQGIVIVSGLALGIDTISHKACLEVGGQTIAVLPSGINNIYPATHMPIAKQIINSGGTLLSEYPDNHQPRKKEFHERNRIIAALSDVVVIPEAALLSGSLNTAGHARRMNIPILAVPGNVNSPMSAGTNSLLKQSANIVTEVNDVLKLLQLNLKLNLERPKQLLIGDTPKQTAILKSLAGGTTQAEEIQIDTKLNTQEFQLAITMLEINGIIESNGIGSWHIK